MQADCWLVEHIEHAGQSAANLAGQPNALALTARERGGAAGQAQIVEADIDEEGQPVADLPHEVAGDVPLVVGQPQPLEKIECRPERPAADLVEGMAVEPNGRRVVA